MAEFDRSTLLAFERTRVAYDRTMMAWIRTATSLISFGFSIYKFFQLEPGVPHPSGRLIGSHRFALLMVVLGLVSLLTGVIEHRINIRSLRRQYPDLPRSATPWVAGLVGALGILALLAVGFRQ